MGLAASQVIPPIEMGEVGPPWFDEMPVAVIGGGMSLKGFDLNRLRGLCHVIAVKSSIFELPWADCGVGIDFPRLREWCHALEAVTMPVYWAVMPHLWQDAQRREQKLKKPNCMTFLDKQDGFRISTDPKVMYVGGTSGFAGLALAVLKRAKRFPIYLFGFDYGGNAGGYHWAPQHYRHKRIQEQTYWDNWARSYSLVASTLKAMDIKVINASPESKITCFEKVTIECAVESLARLHAERGRRLRGGEIERAASPNGPSSHPGIGAERLDSARLLPTADIHS